VCRAFRVAGLDDLGVRVNPFGAVFEQKLTSTCLESHDRAMCEGAVVGNLAGEEVGKPADREVRVSVG
jgi:hypothetical protein